MKFYIASKLENFAQVQTLAGKLKSAGWVHTYDWALHGSVKESNIELLKEVGQNEYDGVKNADIVIVLMPGGRGTHTELGMAIAFNKKIYLCHTDDKYFKCDDNTSAFYWLPQVNQFIGSLNDAADMLLNWVCIFGGCQIVIQYRLASIDEIEMLAKIRVNFLREANDICETEENDLYENNKEFFAKAFSSGSFAAYIATENNKIIATSGISFFELPPNKKSPNGKTADISNLILGNV